MITKHIDLLDALTQLSDERIEEALLLDSAEALSKAKCKEKTLRTRSNNQRLKRWIPVPLCAALCLAVVLPLTLPRLPLYSAWRQPCEQMQACTESACRLGSHRTMARIGMAFYPLGTVLRSFDHS